MKHLKKSAVTVIIPSYNGRDKLAKLLPAVLKACSPAQVIVSDDGSTDGTARFLKNKYPQIQITRSEHNHGFASACNLASRSVQTPYILFLNNDISPQPDFLDFLLDSFTKRPNLFAVSPLELNPGSKLYPKSGRSVGSFKRGLLQHRAHPKQVSGETLWCSGGSMLVSRNKFQTLGGFKEIYNPGYWEDIDLSWRAHQHHWSTRFNANSVVTHYHRSTFSAMYSARQIEILSYRNMFLFHWLNLRRGQLCRHLIWLPINLAIELVPTRGRIVFGFFQAIHLLIKL